MREREQIMNSIPLLVRRSSDIGQQGFGCKNSLRSQSYCAGKIDPENIEP